MSALCDAHTRTHARTIVSGNTINDAHTRTITRSRAIARRAALHQLHRARLLLCSTAHTTFGLLVEIDITSTNIHASHHAVSNQTRKQHNTHTRKTTHSSFLDSLDGRATTGRPLLTTPRKRRSQNVRTRKSACACCVWRQSSLVIHR